MRRQVKARCAFARPVRRIHVPCPRIVPFCAPRRGMAHRAYACWSAFCPCYAAQLLAKIGRHGSVVISLPPGTTPSSLNALSGAQAPLLRRLGGPRVEAARRFGVPEAVLVVTTSSNKGTAKFE